MGSLRGAQSQRENNTERSLTDKPSGPTGGTETTRSHPTRDTERAWNHLTCSHIIPPSPLSSRPVSAFKMIPDSFKFQLSPRRENPVRDQVTGGAFSSNNTQRKTSFLFTGARRPTASCRDAAVKHEVPGRRRWEVKIKRLHKSEELSLWMRPASFHLCSWTEPDPAGPSRTQQDQTGPRRTEQDADLSAQ